MLQDVKTTRELKYINKMKGYVVEQNEKKHLLKIQFIEQGKE